MVDGGQGGYGGQLGYGGYGGYGKGYCGYGKGIGRYSGFNEGFGYGGYRMDSEYGHGIGYEKTGKFFSAQRLLIYIWFVLNLSKYLFTLRLLK